jgi:uncharacterized protein YcfJ
MTEKGLPGMKHRYLTIAVLLITGCAGGSYQPVLYPNDYYQKVGTAQVQKDIAECRSRAEQAIASDPAGKVAQQTFKGGASGAVMGAVTGDPFGGVTGAAGGLIQGLADSSEPDPLLKGYMERCLKEKGYDVLGWK